MVRIVYTRNFTIFSPEDFLQSSFKDFDFIHGHPMYGTCSNVFLDFDDFLKK